MNILLTGGRAPGTLCLARKLNGMGFKVFIAESINYHICKYSNSVSKSFFVCSPRDNINKYKEDILKIITSCNIDFLIPTCEEIFYISKIKDELIKHTYVFVDELSKLNKLHNKFLFMNIVNENKFIRKPKTVLVSSLAELKNISLSLFSDYTKLVIKPVYSRFSSKVKIISKKDLDNIDIKIDKNNEWVVQEYVKGRQICSYTIAKNGQVVSTVLYPTIYKAGLGASITFRNFFNKDICEWIKGFVKQNNINGQIGFDFIEGKGGCFYVLEANPRLTSGIHLTSDKAFDVIINNIQEFNEISVLDNKYMLILAMFSYGVLFIKSYKSLVKWFKTIFSYKDVIFDKGDICPFFHQFWIFLLMFVIGLFKKANLLDLSTADIEWNGEK